MKYIITVDVAPIKSIALKNLPVEGLDASHILEIKTPSVAVLSQYLEALQNERTVPTSLGMDCPKHVGAMIEDWRAPQKVIKRPSRNPARASTPV